MKRYLIAAALVAFTSQAMGGAAQAADMAVKAQPFQVSNGYSGSGFYFGVYGQGGAGSVQTSANVPGVNPAGLTDTYGTIGGLVGYNYAPANSPRSYFLEVEIGYQNLNGIGNNFSFNGPISMDFIAAVSAPMDQITAFLPNLIPSGTAFPAFPIPNGVTAKNMHGYIGFDGHLYDASAGFGVAQGTEWIFQPGVKVGMLTQYSNNAVVDTGISVFGSGNSMCFGSSGVACVKPGTTVIGTVALRF